jgi:predicted outer membrane repeat protein
MIGIIIEIKESILNNNIAEENGGAIYFSTIDIDYTLKN